MVPEMADETIEQFDTPSNNKVRLAVYDFDGTCISANSPVLLVKHLVRDGLLGAKQASKIIFWALRYKFRLPQNESSVRAKVFSAFEGKPAEDVDEYLRLFYDEIVSPLWRSAAAKSMREHKDEGCFVMVVSASWQAIVDRAREEYGFDEALATKMVIDGAGNYTCQVEGLPVEGMEKLRVIQRYADKHFGVGNWELAYAYGDHHSDAPLLEAAQQAFAVTPDKPLARAARSHKWTMLDWEDN